MKPAQVVLNSFKDIPLAGDPDAAKKLLSEAGYANQPVSCIVAQDQAFTKAMGEITADLLKKLGMSMR